MAGHCVSYYSHVDSMYVFVGKDPIEANFAIQPNELDVNAPLAISLR